MTITLSALQKQRRDTAANWTAENPTLLAGEIGIEFDTGKIKIGNGSSAWTALAYTSWSQLSAYPIVNADVATSAAIAGTKISPNFGSQAVTTTGTNTAASFIPTSSTVPTNGVYLPSASTVAISTNGSRALSIDANGKIIVGKTPYYLNGGNSAYFGTNSLSTAYTDTAFQNTAFGPLALESFNGTGYTANTAIGNAALRYATSGTYNTALGNTAGTAITTGNSNLCLGNNAGSSITTGSNNVILGNIAGTSTLANTVIIGDGAGNERLRIDSSGRLGLGTSSPVWPLDVRGSGNFFIEDGFLGIDAQSSPRLGFVKKAGGAPFLAIGSATSFQISHSSGTEINPVSTNTYTPRFTIDTSGRVGVGTASPASALHVVSPASTSWFAFRGTTNGWDFGTFINSTGAVIGYLGGGGSAVTSGASTDFAIRSEGNLLFASNQQERARLDSSGRLLVGTSSDSGGALLQVNGDRIRVGTAKTPASATATGTAGEICWDTSYVYVCTAANTWKRSALSTW